MVCDYFWLRESIVKNAQVYDVIHRIIRGVKWSNINREKNPLYLSVNTLSPKVWTRDTIF